jgi:hypothetical protein
MSLGCAGEPESTSSLSQATATTPERVRRVDIYNAYWYSDSSSHTAETRMVVAVDAQVVRGAEPWSLSELQLVDDDGNVVGHYHDVAFLNENGSFFSWLLSTDDKGLTGRERVLLLFPVSRNIKSVRLSLRGQPLSTSATQVEPSGPVLPARSSNSTLQPTQPASCESSFATLSRAGWRG